VFHLDFFTVNLNEEYSGLNGYVLKTQTEFLRFCVNQILKLYKHNDNNSTSILVVGHSMVSQQMVSIETKGGKDFVLYYSFVIIYKHFQGLYV